MNNTRITKEGHFIFSWALFYIMFSLCLSLFYYYKIEKDPVSFYSNSNKEWSDVRKDISKSDFLETRESWKNITSEIKNLQDPFLKDDKNKYAKSFSDMLSKNLKETIDLIKSKKIKREKEVDSITINDFVHLKTKEKPASLEQYIEKIKLVKEKQKNMKYIKGSFWVFSGSFIFMAMCGMIILTSFSKGHAFYYHNKLSLILLLSVAPAFCLCLTVF